MSIAPRRIVRIGVPLLVAFAAMFLALLLTPRVPVTTFGQKFLVGAVRPPAALSWSGPGQAELFGEGYLPTVQRFNGFVRPAIVWNRFEQSRASARFLQSRSADNRPQLAAEAATAGHALASGWEHYVLRLVLLAAGMGAALELTAIGAIVLVNRRDRPGSQRSLRSVLLAAVLASAVTASFAGVTAVSAYHQLRDVTSLADLVGAAQLAPVPKVAGSVLDHVSVVVIGDSTAAGEGNPLVAHPGRDDRACRRSQDSYAHTLQTATGSQVLNLACSSATVGSGLLGPQTVHGTVVPAQVGRLKAVSSAQAVIVSIGANDVGWTDFVRYCAVAPQCGNRVDEQLFHSRIDRFKVQYAQLLQQLAELPRHPSVIVNQYYDPLGPSVDCLEPSVARGSSPSPSSSASSPPGGLAGNVDTLRSEIAQLNAVLANGATAFHDLVVRPDFTGHTVCSAQPWVQGADAAAPLHPTSAGELAIAAADLPHLPVAPSHGIPGPGSAGRASPQAPPASASAVARPAETSAGRRTSGRTIASPTMVAAWVTSTPAPISARRRLGQSVSAVPCTS
jgi:lysophospholipase L1-like esterase